MDEGKPLARGDVPPRAERRALRRRCRPHVHARRPRGALRQGRAVLVDPIKPTLKAPGTKRLTLRYDKLLSTFAFKSNLRRFIKAVKSCISANRDWIPPEGKGSLYLRPLLIGKAVLL